MDIRINSIDCGNAFDFGRTAAAYARYRDIYPAGMYENLHTFGIGVEGQNVLDLGTGTGVLPRNMAQYGAAFTGMDIAEEQVQQARALSEGLPIDYVTGTAEHLPFGDSTFDAVTACQCFHYFDADVVIPEIKRVLVKGGRLCILHMEWLPEEDAMIGEMEQLVLSYNPSWSGKGYQKSNYSTPLWAGDSFLLQTYHAYDDALVFTTDDWCGRIQTCRGVGVSLSKEKAAQFDSDHRALLAPYAKNGKLTIPHQIVVEVYTLR